MRQTLLLLLLSFLPMCLSAPDTQGLLQQLKRIAATGNVYMGHHDDTFYGRGWFKGACEKSDLEELSGHRPMVLSVDLCPLELQNGYMTISTEKALEQKKELCDNIHSFRN